MKEPSLGPGNRPHAPGRGAAVPRAHRLADSQSPYLLQHARNPVEWWTWGPEAIAEARRRGVPLFVSVGYSTCYWCHVMERESFEREDVAQLLNAACVPVKVDREVRPDVDELLMTACQVFTQLTEGRPSGGWPLNVFLDPETLEPFFCGTYFPPEAGFGRPSFTELVAAVARAWAEDRAGLSEQASRIAGVVRRQMALPAEAASASSLGDDASVADTAQAILRLADPSNGGFGGAPKFPTPAYPRFLLEAGAPTAEPVLRRTLDAMAIGGIFDQVGGGFHRYSVDASWTVPHFEKMLYDNGQLASLYAAAYRRWGDAFHGEVARRTCEWVLREMVGEDGRFLCAQDAEVDAREGANYLWSPESADAAMVAAGQGPLAEFARRLYGLDGPPNFRDPHDAEALPVHVLRLAGRPDELARGWGMTMSEFRARRTAVDAALLAARGRRPQPSTDDKTVVAWAALMAEGMADAGAALGIKDFVAAAGRAIGFILDQMRSPDGGLLRAWRAEIASQPAFLEDYANLSNACLALAGATGDWRWRDEAASILAMAEARFLDPSTGAWFDVEAGADDLFARVRAVDDGAMPSGTASALRAMAAIAASTHDAALLARARRAVEAIAPAVLEQPVASSGSVLAARALRSTGG